MIRALICAICALLLATPAHAVQCFSQADLYATLSAEYGEAPQAQGLSGDGMLMQVWAGESTWTLLIVTPEGQACVIATGLDFMDARERPKPDL